MPTTQILRHTFVTPTTPQFLADKVLSYQSKLAVCGLKNVKVEAFEQKDDRGLKVTGILFTCCSKLDTYLVRRDALDEKTGKYEFEEYFETNTEARAFRNLLNEGKDVNDQIGTLRKDEYGFSVTFHYTSIEDAIAYVRSRTGMLLEVQSQAADQSASSSTNRAVLTATEQPSCEA